MRHRGPDADGIHIARTRGGVPVGLGNVRLAIQDLSTAGHQPMHAGDATIVMNGEIYNHREVRRTLGGQHPFAGTSDTETVLAAWGRWGAGSLAHLRGMFAVALFDATDDSLWIARDRLGMKPVYIAQGDFGTALASELRALLAMGLVAPRVDRGGVDGFLRYGCIPEPLTLMEGVRRLPAACTLHVCNGVADAPTVYWDPVPLATGAAPAEPEEIRGLLSDAVEEHLLSDVPVATLLSGGIDSSIVAALAAQAASAPVTAFTVGLDDGRLDESPWAAKVAARHGIQHEVVRLSLDDVREWAPAAATTMDMPSVDGFNTWIVSRAIAQAGFKVALTGLAGDELFGGYETFSRLARARHWARRLGWLPHGLRVAVGGGGERGQRTAALIAPRASPAERYNTLRAFWSERALRRFEADPTISLATWLPPPGAPPATATSLLELGGYMRSMLLRDADANSMAHSLELRLPFLDHRLVELCLRHNAAAGHPPKHHLLRAAGDLLPDGLAKRAKQGFVLPMDAWMRGPLRDLVHEGLSSVRAHRPGATMMDAVERDWSRGRVSWTRVWALVALGLTLQRLTSRVANLS